MAEEDRGTETIAWKMRVPIFRDRTILTQLSIAIGIPFTLLFVILFVVSGGDVTRLWFPLVMVGVLFVLTYVFIQVVYGGTYDVAYELDDRGVLVYTQSAQAQRSNIVNALTVLLSLFAARPSLAGAGMLAGSRLRVFLPWEDVRRVHYEPERRTIMLRAAGQGPIALFCDEGNYQRVEEAVRRFTA
jgi:hypothetical protein